MQYSSGFTGRRRASDASAHYLEAFVMRFEPEVLIDARWRFSCGVTDKNNLGVTILGNVVDGPEHEFAVVAIQTQSWFV